MGDTIERANGRWHDVLVLLGMDKKFLTGKQTPCPMCGGTDRFCFDDQDGEGTWICRSCGAGYGSQLVMKFKGWDWKQAADAVDAVLGEARQRQRRERKHYKSNEVAGLVRRRWDGSTAIGASANVRRYLESRGIAFARLRGHGFEKIYDLRESTRGNMVALVRDARGHPCQVHCTFLADGRKADVEKPRKVMRLPFPEGAAVRLFDYGEDLGIAEGIETALSAAQLFGCPVWAALNAPLLRKWVPPKGVKRVHIYGDNDANYAGQAAAYHLAHRLQTHQRIEVEHVVVEIPQLAAGDWNDVLRAGRRAVSTAKVAEEEARC